jgi:uncharacterized protein DUF2652
LHADRILALSREALEPNGYSTPKILGRLPADRQSRPEILRPFGQIAKQAMSGHEELIGRDVILIHRLLKNDVEAKFGRRAYGIYTDVPA